MKSTTKSISFATLIIPMVISLLVICVTIGYGIYRLSKERAYRLRWKEYDGYGYVDSKSWMQ